MKRKKWRTNKGSFTLSHDFSLALTPEQKLMGSSANWLDEEDTVALVHTDQVFQTDQYSGATIEGETVLVPVQLAENQTDRYACLERVAEHCRII